MEMTRSLLKVEIATPVYLINKLLTQAIQNRMPYEVWHGVKPSVGHLTMFRSIVFALILAQKHLKLNEKFEKCILLGYCSETKAYKLYNPATCNVVVCLNPSFLSLFA